MATGFSFIIHNELARGLTISFSITIALLAASDLYFRAIEDPDLTDVSFPLNYHVFADDLGKRTPLPGSYNVVSRRKSTSDTVYDATYTIGANGFRQTDNVAPGTSSVVFFGGSYTYGEGVDDAETYPAQFSKALDYRYRVINAGFSGYGPHQMLRLLETGRVDAATEGPVAAAYFLMIDNHMNRAAGLHWWNLHSPRYVIDATGNIRLDGLNSKNKIATLLAALERQKGLPGRLSRALAELLVPRGVRVDVTAAIVGRSATLLRQKFGVDLYCLFWGSHWSKDFALLARRLEGQGVKVLRVTDLIEDLSASQVGILPGIENHPSADFHKRFGEAIALRHFSTLGLGSGTKVPNREGNEVKEAP